MTQGNVSIFGEKYKFAIEINILQECPLISFWAEDIETENPFAVFPFRAEKFLYCMSTAWGRLFLEQIYPVATSETVFSPQHFVFLNKNDEKISSTIKDFRQTHDIGSWLDDSFELYFMRQGDFIEITWDRKIFAFPLPYIMNILTSLGNFLSEKVTSNYKELWHNKENITPEHLFAYASGILDPNNALRETIAKKCSFSFHELVKDHPYLAVARMAQASKLSTNDALVAIKVIENITIKNCDKLENQFPSWFVNTSPDSTDSSLKPYEQAYALAKHVREHIEKIEPNTKKIQIYPLLSKIGYEVFEKKLPDEIHALCVWSNNAEQFIVLNTSNKALGSKNYLHRAAMAHELCHILLDKERSRPLVDLMLLNQDDPIEKRARAFAPELLLPRSSAINFIAGREDKREAVDLLSWKYEVSLSIVANQLRNGAESTGRHLPPRISEYVDEILTRSYYYDNHDTALEHIKHEILALKQLQPGWYEGSGSALSPAGLTWLVENIEGSFQLQRLIIPGVFPTPDGHVQLEWNLSDYQGILEFNLEKKQADWLMFNINNPDQGVELQIDLSIASGWYNLVCYITKLMEVAAND